MLYKSSGKLVGERTRRPNCEFTDDLAAVTVNRRSMERAACVLEEMLRELGEPPKQQHLGDPLLVHPSHMPHLLAIIKSSSDSSIPKCLAIWTLLRCSLLCCAVMIPGCP